MRRMRAAGVRPRRHARQPHQPHQALHALAIDTVTSLTQKYDHFAAAVERVPCIFLVDQIAEQQVDFSYRLGLAARIDRRARHARQRALLNHAHRVAAVDPRLANHGRLIPDFFFSQSSSTFSLPISL